MSQQRRIDVGLYELAIAQRNEAWQQVEVLTSRVAVLQRHLTNYTETVRFVVDDNDWRKHAYGGEWDRLHADDVLDEIEKALR